MLTVGERRRSYACVRDFTAQIELISISAFDEFLPHPRGCGKFCTWSLTYKNFIRELHASHTRTDASAVRVCVKVVRVCACAWSSRTKILYVKLTHNSGCVCAMRVCVCACMYKSGLKLYIKPERRPCIRSILFPTNNFCHS